jgi:hypothetical protein
MDYLLNIKLITVINLIILQDNKIKDYIAGILRITGK